MFLPVTDMTPLMTYGAGPKCVVVPLYHTPSSGYLLSNTVLYSNWDHNEYLLMLLMQSSSFLKVMLKTTLVTSKVFWSSCKHCLGFACQHSFAAPIRSTTKLLGICPLPFNVRHKFLTYIFSFQAVSTNLCHDPPDSSACHQFPQHVSQGMPRNIKTR